MYFAGHAPFTISINGQIGILSPNTIIVFDFLTNKEYGVFKCYLKIYNHLNLGLTRSWLK